MRSSSLLLACVVVAGCSSASESNAPVAPKAGGAASVVAQAESPTGAVVVDGASLYFADEHAGELYRVARSGGERTTIATIGQSFALGFDGIDFYFLTGEVMRVPASGGVP